MGRKKKLWGAALKAVQKKERKLAAQKARKAKAKAKSKPKPKKKGRSTVAKNKKKGGTRRRKSSNTTLKTAMWMVGGAAVGAAGDFVMREQKIKPNTTSMVLVGAGLVGATQLKGNAKWFCAGLATAGATQYSFRWSQSNLKRKGGTTPALPAADAAPALPAPRDAAPPVVVQPDNRNESNLQEAFEEAQEVIAAQEYQDAA